MSYLNWQTKILSPGELSPSRVADLYEAGFVATRVDKGVFNQTRSVRIRLSDFELSSENRRILRKTEALSLQAKPLPYADYHWSIHKLAKDFYTDKFGKDTFSANKVKEVMTDPKRSNFNLALVYSLGSGKEAKAVGYCIGLEIPPSAEGDGGFLHYSYPFYDQSVAETMPSIGLGMMTRAVVWAKERGLAYVYLGSLQRPSDTYKLQFSGMEWFDGSKWQKNLEPLKQILK